jgi:catechol 2,3-dioxygenase-like lactoylglutathione lyase family enzyme
MSLKLSHINVVVRDMGAMAGFYGRLGVSLGESPPEWAAHHRSSDDDTDGGPRVDLDSDQFARVWNQGWAGGPGIVLVFGVESRSEVDRLYEDLTASGCPGQQPPYDAFWGARFAVVADPDGNSVGLMSDIDPNRRTAPPTPAFD